MLLYLLRESVSPRVRPRPAAPGPRIKLDPGSGVGIIGVTEGITRMTEAIAR